MKGVKIVKKIRVQQTQESMTLTDSIGKFIVRCKVKNLSPRTIHFYETDLERFSKWYGSNTVDGIDSSLVESYILYLQTETDANDATVASNIRALRTFLYYIMERGSIKPFTVHIPRQEQKIKETYTTSELVALLKKPNMKKCTFAEFRSWVLINYLIGTGNRISTALAVKNRDLDFDDCTIRLNTVKNRRQQVIPMAQTLKAVLIDYLDIRGGKPDDYLFCTETGEQLSYAGARDGVYAFNASRGVTKTGLHRFRHSFAKMWILSGGDPFRLQKMLGHSDISVTKQYVSMFGIDLKKDFERFNPLDNYSPNRDRISVKHTA